MLLSPLHLRWCLFRCLFSCFCLLFSRIPVNGRQFSKCTNRIQQAICFSVTMSAWYWNPPVLASPCHPLPMELRELFESFHCGLGGVIEVLLPTSQSSWRRHQILSIYYTMSSYIYCSVSLVPQTLATMAQEHTITWLNFSFALAWWTLQPDWQ